MKTKYFFLFFLFTATTLISQVSFNGIVKDSIGNTLEITNVIEIENDQQ